MWESSQINDELEAKERLLFACWKLLNSYTDTSGDSLDTQIDNLKKAIEKRDFFLAFGTKPGSPYEIFRIQVKEASKNDARVELFFEIDFGFITILEEKLSLLMATKEKVEKAIKCTENTFHYRANTIAVGDETLILNVHKSWEPNQFNGKPYVEVLLYGDCKRFIRLNCIISTYIDYAFLPVICARKLNIGLDEAENYSIPNTLGASNLAKKVQDLTLEINGKTGKATCVFVAGDLAIIGITTLLTFTNLGINKNGWFLNKIQ